MERKRICALSALYAAFSGIAVSAYIFLAEALSGSKTLDIGELHNIIANPGHITVLAAFTVSPAIAAWVAGNITLCIVPRSTKYSRFPWWQSLLLVVISYPIFGALIGLTAAFLDPVDAFNASPSLESAWIGWLIYTFYGFGLTFWFTLPVGLILAFHIGRANKRLQATPEPRGGSSAPEPRR